MNDLLFLILIVLFFLASLGLLLTFLRLMK